MAEKESKGKGHNAELKSIDKNLKEINANLSEMTESLKYISYAAIFWITLTIIGLLLFVYIIAALTAPTEVIEAT